MTASEALEWLYSAQQFGIKLGLENTQRLLAAVGNPERRCRFLHVAGTNGKGSVCAMIDSILRAGGYRTGLYTSPHLIDFRERIRVNGEMIPDDDLARILTELRSATATWSHAPTFFELATVLAIRHFADCACEFVVLETGMGGRLDSTNAVTPIVSVLTPIAMDHSQWLGGTLAKIAGEKAGVLKSGVPAVSAEQTDEVVEVLRAKAREVGTSLEFITDSFEGAVGLRGSHQRSNAGLARAAIKVARIPLDERSIWEGVANVHWPGRFEVIGNFVLDGGHNLHASRQLVNVWRETFRHEKPRIIFGALEDKDYREMLEVLSAIAREFLFVPVRSERSVEPELLLAGCRSNARVIESLQRAIELSRDELTLITGSLFLVGEAMELLRRS